MYTQPARAAMYTQPARAASKTLCVFSVAGIVPMPALP